MIWRGTILAFGLVSVICWEFQAEGENAGMLAPPEAVPGFDAGQSGQIVTTPEGGTEASASIALQRPLFRPDRRPAATAAAVGDASPDKALPRLAGIVVTASARRAIFDGGDGKPAVAAESSRLGSLQVIRIAADRVTVSGPSGTFVLRPEWRAAVENPAPVAVHRLGNTVSVSGATFGAVPANRLARLRDQVAASIQTLKASP